MFLIVVFVTLLAYWIAVQHKRNCDLNAKLQNIPGTNLAYPILGDVHVWAIRKWSIHDKMDYFIEMMRGYHTTLKLWFGSKLVVVINNPEDIKTILTSPNCTDKSSVYHLTIGGDGIFVANGNKWKNQRRHLNTAFSTRILNSYADNFNHFGRNIVAAVKERATNGNEFDITPTLGIYVTDLITRTIYGSAHQKFEVSKHCYELVERLMIFWGERMIQIYFHIFLVLVRKIFRITSEDKKLNRDLRSGLQPIFTQKIKEYQNNCKFNEIDSYDGINNVKDEHFLDKLTRLRFEGAIGVTEYRHTSMTMFMAATETTARSISIVILMLAIHEDHQQKIYEEICNIFDFESTTADIDISKLTELRLLDRFIKETFRIFPVIPLFGRRPSRDILIKEGLIPAGTDIFISVVNLHQHPHIWGDDPMKFNPDNFLPEAEAKRGKCSYLPFSFGPRNCIGYKFAQISMSVGIVYLLQNYRFKTKLKIDDIKMAYGVTTYLLNDNLISVQARNLNYK